MATTSLPKINNPQSSLPGLVYLPGVNQRDPITGKVTAYNSLYAEPAKARGRNKYGSAHQTTHELSVFESTGYQRPYFIIHPQWTSEASGAKRLSLKERGLTSWDSRPAYPNTLSTYTETFRRPTREDLMQSTIAAQKSYENQMSARESTHFKPITPRDRQGTSVRYSIY